LALRELTHLLGVAAIVVTGAACAAGTEIESAVRDEVPAADSVTCEEAGSVPLEGSTATVYACVLRYSGGDRFDRCYVLESGQPVDVTEALAGTGRESFDCASER